MQIGKICKTLGYGGILCSALVFANPCQGGNQFIFDTTNASYAPSTDPLIINQFISSEFAGQNADNGELRFQNGAALNIDVKATSEANALALYNGVDFTMAAQNGSIPSAGALTLTSGTSDVAYAYNGSAILVQRETGYSTYWDGVCNTQENIGDGKTYADQAAANAAKAITAKIELASSANNQTITGQYGIKIVGLRSASAGHGSTNATTDYAGDTVNITLGGTGINRISGTSGAIYRDSVLGTVNATVAPSSIWELTGNSNVDNLTLGNRSEINLKLQDTPPADNTSGVSVMTVNTALNLPTGETDSSTVWIQWQKVTDGAAGAADTISQSYLALPSGATGDWSKLNINLSHPVDFAVTGDLKLDEGDKILLVSQNTLDENGSYAAFTESKFLFNRNSLVESNWFTNGHESNFQLERDNNNLYAKVVSDVIKISHYSYNTSMKKRVVIYPRFAKAAGVPSLKVDDEITDDCASNYSYRSHLSIVAGNSLAYNDTTTDKAAVTIMNNYTNTANNVTDTWSDADSIATDQACDVFIKIADGEVISRTQSTGNAIAISTFLTFSDDHSYVPALRIAAAGSGAITATSADGNAFGVMLTGTSFAAAGALDAYNWFDAVFDASGTEAFINQYAYRFEAPITATTATGSGAYGIYVIRTDSNEASPAKVLITKNVRATGGIDNYAVVGHGKVDVHFGGGVAGSPNTVETTGDLNGQFVVNEYTTLDINARTIIYGSLTDNGVVAINANFTQPGSLTGQGNITVGAASKAAVFDCSAQDYLGKDCSLTLAPTTGAAIACTTGHSGIVAIKTLTGGTNDHFGGANGAFTGQETSKLLLAGKGGTVNGAITGFDKLIFGYHKGAPELTYDTDETINLGATNDDDTNNWTLNGAITGKDIIVRHGNITAKGSVNLTGQLYVLGCNFCTNGIVKIAGGEYSHEEMLSFDRNSKVEISNKANSAEITALTVDGVQITPDTLSSILSLDKKKFLADIVLGSSAEKGGAVLGVDSNNVTLNSYTVDGNNIGILAIGNENDINLNAMPTINYLSQPDAPAEAARSVQAQTINYENCYAIKGNKTTTLNVKKLSESSILNGKVLVGAMSIDATGEKLTLTNNNDKSGNGVLHTNKLTVDLVSFEGWNLVETEIPEEAKLEVANLEPLSGSEIDVEIVHIGKAVDGDKIPLVKCDKLDGKYNFVPKQTFLREYAISYDTDVYVATVTKSMTHEQAARKLGLNTSYGRFLDSDIKMKDELYWNQIRYVAGEQAYTTIANWSARSDHMEKARITSSMMSAYNEVMLARRGVHNFNQEHKLISWISGFGDWFKQDGVKYLGAKANTYGIIAGADYQLNDKWLFSLSCGYANSDVNLNGKGLYRSNGSGHQDSFVSSTAMTYKNKLGNGKFSAIGLFTSAFVHHKYNYKLQINENNAGENESGHEKYHGFALSLGLDADWMFNYKDTAVKYGPIVQVGFDRTSQDGHNTTCSDSKLSFSTKEANVNNLWSILGAKVEYDCTLQQKKVNMYCQAGWKFQYLRNGANVRRNMLNSSTEFTSTGTYVDKSMLALKLGVSLFATESFNLGVEYGLDYNSKVHSNRANVEMSYMF